MRRPAVLDDKVRIFDIVRLMGSNRLQTKVKPFMLAQYTSRFAPYAPAILRVIVGIVFLFHGLDKFRDLQGVAGFFGGIGIPAPQVMALVVALIEAVGGFLLIIGFLTRYVNVLHIVVMIVAIFTVKLGVGLIAPFGQGVGYELDLLLLGASLALLILGPGTPSVDKNVLSREF